MLTAEIIASIESSVLCWLATSVDDIPNVSPKEVFTFFGDSQIIIANIASPQTVKNIQRNPNVSVSFIDILVQKGYQLKGTAEIISKKQPQFSEMEPKLQVITQGLFPFSTRTCITIKQIKTIIAPSYLLYPETRETEQIQAAKKQYGL
jgi:predicted pyridoxine 5'-phosphate oxidase superfamily flavin-nucleotide-binding protein